MVQEISGSFEGDSLDIGVVVAEFNDAITENLLDGALKTFRQCNVPDENITVYRVPGSFEIPGMARMVREKRNHDGIVCLGAVIRGGTPHFDYICQSVTQGLSRLRDESDIPVVYGILTTDTVEQAVDRSGTKAGNKGNEAALALVQLIDAYKQL